MEQTCATNGRQPSGRAAAEVGAVHRTARAIEVNRPYLISGARHCVPAVCCGRLVRCLKPRRRGREKALAGLGSALLLVALLAAYANHFHNSFHFDDAHTIVNNAAIRELRNIPLFFRDATTFSALPSNQSYRPLVSTLLAIDYRLGGTATVLVSPFDLRALRRAHAAARVCHSSPARKRTPSSPNRLDRARRCRVVRVASGKRRHASTTSSHRPK